MSGSALAAGADLLLHDAQYTEEEYPTKLGWGHSTWNAGVKAAKKAGAKNLLLFHHEPAHNDKTILEMEAKAKAEFPNTFAAYEGQEFNF